MPDLFSMTMQRIQSCPHADNIPLWNSCCRRTSRAWYLLPLQNSVEASHLTKTLSLEDCPMKPLTKQFLPQPTRKKWCFNYLGQLRKKDPRGITRKGLFIHHCTDYAHSLVRFSKRADRVISIFLAKTGA